jgi:hypothetical protein
MAISQSWDQTNGDLHDASSHKTRLFFSHAELALSAQQRELAVVVLRGCSGGCPGSGEDRVKTKPSWESDGSGQEAIGCPKLNDGGPERCKI